MCPEFSIVVVAALLLVSAVAATPRERQRGAVGNGTFFFGWYGDDPKNQAGWVNLGVSGHLDQIQQGIALGIKYQFLHLQSTYLTRGIRDNATALVLRDNWRAIFEANIPLYTSLLKNRTIVGFFLGDELMWNGLAFNSLVEWSNAVRWQFPDAWIWENEAFTVYWCNPKAKFGCFDDKLRPIIAPFVPPALSSTSVDLYLWAPRSITNWVPIVRDYYELFLFPRLLPNQSLFLVPGSAASEHNPICNVSCYDDLCSKDAEQYFEWAKKDKRITGMVPWTWHDCGKNCILPLDEIGTIHMNKTKQAWQRIGREILRSDGEP